MNTLEYTATSAKQLKKLPKTEQAKILKKIKLLKTNPIAGKPLKGVLNNLYSLRAWPYRILYTFVNNVVTIYSVAHRQGAYK